MSREEQFARQICRVLDRGAAQLERGVAERLRAARERALQRQPVLVPGAVQIGAGGTALLGGDEKKHPLRTTLAILVLLFGVGLSYYWNGFSRASENEAIDSALLADVLPPNAYLDKGFQAWLEKDSSAGQ
ncbi:MAG: DUF3619 family protein [Sulfuritalea sp.]|nr:DUF3619 family protein [Sulfuritalea sp.]